jgi:hypothetical protein
MVQKGTSLPFSYRRKKKVTSNNPPNNPLSKDDLLRAILGDVDPAKYSGEGWYPTEEYARPADIQSPYVRGDMMNEGAYYPPPDVKNKFRRY